MQGIAQQKLKRYNHHTNTLLVKQIRTISLNCLYPSCTIFVEAYHNFLPVYTPSWSIRRLPHLDSRWSCFFLPTSELLYGLSLSLNCQYPLCTISVFRGEWHFSSCLHTKLVYQETSTFRFRLPCSFFTDLQTYFSPLPPSLLPPSI